MFKFCITNDKQINLSFKNEVFDEEQWVLTA